MPECAKSLLKANIFSNVFVPKDAEVLIVTSVSGQIFCLKWKKKLDCFLTTLGCLNE